MFTIIIELLGGIGMFLFAMYFIEEALQAVSGRRMKIFLQKMAAKPITAIAGSAIITGVFQSSSMVSLMILAFLGAGVFTTEQSIALVLGANLGTTLDSWLVATLGFSVHIEQAAYPMLFAGAIIITISGKKYLGKQIGILLLGISLIFISLKLMQQAMESTLPYFRLDTFLYAGKFGLLIMGFLITLLMQSSSVTMAIVLTSIHSRLIPLELGVYIVLGGEIATTLKLWLGTLDGNSAKKQLAAGNTLFNIAITLLALAFMQQILYFISGILGIQNPLIALVSFSSLLNLSGIILFIPILSPFSKWLNRLFPASNHHKSAFLREPENCDAETAGVLLQQEVGYFMYNAIYLNASLLQITDTTRLQIASFDEISNQHQFHTSNIHEKYTWLKEHHGEIQSDFLLFRKKNYHLQNSELNLYISSARNILHAAKSMQDVSKNIYQLSRSSKSIKFDFFQQYQQETILFYEQLIRWISKKDTPDYKKMLTVYKAIEIQYQEGLNQFYKEAAQISLSDLEITTLLNFSRESFGSNRSMLLAVKDLLLNETSVQQFNEELTFAS
ncbi:MAG: Na/Pi cotransporter family protein [Chitinophagia bacterium]|nr:Na/Pi cotransporter family protein [Chitinophagia bacterium]